MGFFPETVFGLWLDRITNEFVCADKLPGNLLSSLVLHPLASLLPGSHSGMLGRVVLTAMKSRYWGCCQICWANAGQQVVCSNQRILNPVSLNFCTVS